MLFFVVYHQKKNIKASSQSICNDVRYSASSVPHWRESTLCYEGVNLNFEPTCMWVDVWYPTPTQKTFQNRITQSNQQKVHINPEFYQSIVQIILHAFLRSLNELGSYEQHYAIAHELLRTEIRWGRNSDENIEDYQQRIIQSAKDATDTFFPSTDYGEFVVLNELTRCITDQFRPFDIQGQEPWFIPPQREGHSINWFNFVMNARGKIDDFLRGRRDISQINLRLFEGVTSVGDDFLSCCINIERIDLSPLSRVTSVGDDFLLRCTGITRIDLSGLRNVTSVGNDFLSCCSGITSIDLSPLSRVTSVGYRFLSCCIGITSIDLSPLINLTSVGHGFLFNCFSKSICQQVQLFLQEVIRRGGTVSIS